MKAKELISRLLEYPDATVGFFLAEQDSTPDVHLIVTTDKKTHGGEPIVRSLLRIGGPPQKGEAVVA